MLFFLNIKSDIHVALARDKACEERLDAMRIDAHGGPYWIPNIRTDAYALYTNTGSAGSYRAIGAPQVIYSGESQIEILAAKLGMDPAEFRRRNLAPDDAYPRTYLSGATFEKLSQQASLELLLEKMRYSELRAEQAALRRQKPQSPSISSLSLS